MRSWTTLATLLAALLVTAPVFADSSEPQTRFDQRDIRERQRSAGRDTQPPAQRRGRGSGDRYTVKGDAVVVSKNLRESTLELGEATFKVTPETLMRDREGSPISLRQLPVRDSGSEGGPDLPAIGARFEARRIGDEKVLMRLSVIDRPS